VAERSDPSSLLVLSRRARRPVRAVLCVRPRLINALICRGGRTRRTARTGLLALLSSARSLTPSAHRFNSSSLARVSCRRRTKTCRPPSRPLFGSPASWCGKASVVTSLLRRRRTACEWSSLRTARIDEGSRSPQELVGVNQSLHPAFLSEGSPGYLWRKVELPTSTSNTVSNTASGARNGVVPDAAVPYQPDSGRPTRTGTA
jgi:hypothetical protein